MRETALTPTKSFYTITVSGTSANTSVGPAGMLRLTSTTDCFVNFGSTAPTVSATTGFFLPAGVVEYFDVSEFYGDGGIYVGAIQSTVGGYLYIAVCK